MRRSICSLMVIAVGLVAASGIAMAARGFNTRTISGGYSLKLSGWDLATPTTPVSIIGNLLANRGVLTGNVAINDGGVICSTDLLKDSSSYSVNKDGTGTITAVLDSAGASCKGALPIGVLVLNLTIVNNGYGMDLGARSASPAIMVLSGSATFQGRIK
ncbi:MAG TPA: hypothetical protein VNF29_15980 [Candidatus Binataceae bacterium]|nr:hypothetical protein [Candidatus Binataceae bacterium]